MENKIPTVEEFFDFIPGEIAYPPDFVHRTAIEFAKLHVEAALKEASTKALMDEDWVYDGENENHIYTGIDKDSILDAYPLTNII